MYPFNLPGPDFLVFYIIFGLGVIAAELILFLWPFSWGKREEAAEIANGIAQDPYQMAYLRGGRDETIRVAIASLILRNMLIVDGKFLCSNSAMTVLPRRMLARAILFRFGCKAEGASAMKDSVIIAEVEQIGDTLRRQGLLVGPNALLKRFLIKLSAVVILGGIAGGKIMIALAKGHHNIAFLVILAVVFCFIAMVISKGRRLRTSLGERVYEQVGAVYKKLYYRVKSQVVPVETEELTFAVAAFGLILLSAEMQADFTGLRLYNSQNMSLFSSSSMSGSGCSISASMAASENSYPPIVTFNSNSSGGSSCSSGSSCGGGGCGGGCGGCG